MHIVATQLKPLSTIQLSTEEAKLLGWLRGAPWQPVADAREPTHKTKVPEFYSGTRLFNMQAGNGGMGALELLIKKLQHQGVISKQNLYPLEGQGSARFLTLKKIDMDNLGVGKKTYDDEEDE